MVVVVFRLPRPYPGGGSRFYYSTIRRNLHYWNKPSAKAKAGGSLRLSRLAEKREYHVGYQNHPNVHPQGKA